jgi:hypothetical protein
LFGFVATLLILGLAACGGDGGDGGGGGGIPTATNAAITPPPTTPLAITTGGGAMPTNQSIAANAFQAGGGALSDATDLLGSVQGGNSGTQARREPVGAIVRRHAEMLKDHHFAKPKNPSSVTGAVQVQTQPCPGGGTFTTVVDDVNLSSAQVWVSCNQAGFVTHGTVSSSNFEVIPHEVGQTVGSSYRVEVKATIAIDLSVATPAPVSTSVVQGSFVFSTTFFGFMQAAPNGGLEAGPPNRAVVSMDGTNLLSLDGTVRERLSDFFISIDEDDTLGSTAVSGHYTYASTIIGGSVIVNISSPLVTQPQGALHPTSGAVTITSPASLGKIVVTVISSPFAGVRVDVYADAANVLPTDTINLDWTTVEAL